MRRQLQTIISSLKEFKGIIAGLIILSVICSALTSYVFTKPVYEATAQVLVNQDIDGALWMDKWTLKAESLSILTFIDMIESPLILEQVGEKLDLEESAGELNEKITVHFANNSQVFNVTVRHENPVMAAAMANTTANVFIETWLGLERGNNVKILSEAKMNVNAQPVDTGGAVRIGLSIFLAAAAGVAVRILTQTIDTALRSEEDVEEMLDTPVIGRISAIPEEKGESAARALKW